MMIAIAGKGGVGKSTVATMLTLALGKESLVLAVDADPNPTLAEKLGMDARTTLAQVREGSREAGADGVPKHEAVALRTRMALEEGEGFDLLTMGRPEGRGCYCYINNVLKGTLEDMSDRYPWVVVDNEAGMEHLSRGLLPSVDALVIVSDATPAGLRTAGRIAELADELGLDGVKRVMLVNRIRGQGEISSPRSAGVLVLMPADPELEIMDMEGEPVQLDRISTATRAALGRLIASIRDP